MFVISAKLPVSKTVMSAFLVSKSRALLISLMVGTFFSISKPLTYALAGEILIASKSELAILPSSVVAPTANLPVFSFTVTHSSTLN